MPILEYLRPSKEKTPVIRGFSIGGALVNYDLSYEVYFKFYRNNPYIKAVINKRGNEIGARGWELRKGNGKKIYNEEFEELIKTSTSQTPKEFFKRISRDLDLTGNAYLYIVKDKEGARGKKIGLQILDPRYIKPVSNEYGKILGYVQNLKGVRVFLPDELFHLKDDNDIENEIVGASRMEALFIDIETDQEARDSNLAFFKNNQTPSSLIILSKDFEVGEAEDESALKEKIRNMFEGGKYVGGKNKHRSAVIQGVEKVEKIQDKISDAEFLELRKFTLELVCAVYETPKAILGFTDGVNYANGDNQYNIYMDVTEEREDKIAAFIESALKEFDEKYELVMLKDNLRKLVVKSEIAGKLYKTDELITKNEAREIIQYDKVDGGDEFSQTNSLTIDAKSSDEKK